MSYKTVTIKESVYNKLLQMKKKDESFSDLLDRLVNINIQVLRNIRGTQTYDDKDELLNEINQKRREL